MNTAALLPSPPAAARPSADVPAVTDAAAEAALPAQEGFAVALVALLGADAETAAPPLPAPLPATVAELPQLPGEHDDADTPEPLDPQSAFALAALGLLPAAVVPQAPAPVAPAPAGDDAAVATAGPAQPVALMPAAAPAIAPANAPVNARAEPRPAAAAPALPLPAAAPAVPQAEPAPGAAQAAAAAVSNAVPTGAVKAASTEAAPETPRKTERAGVGAELPAVATPAAAPARPAAVPAMAQPAVALKGEAPQWQQPLLQALGDRLQLQISTRSDQAVIRLEPPMLGQVEIAIRQQAGDLQVRIVATHDEVTRQIQQVGEQLRQGLVQRHGGEVSVQVAQPGGAGRESEPRGGAQQQAAQDDRQQARDEQQQQQQQRRPGRGLDGGDATRFAADLAALKA